MSKKKLFSLYVIVLTLVILISPTQVTASPAVCNPQGAISCSNLPAGSDCMAAVQNVPPGMGTIDCVVNSVQNIDTQYLQNYYILHSLTIQPSGNLRFFYQTTKQILMPQIVPHNAGGALGARGVTSYSFPGGDGGTGGNTSSAGTAGIDAVLVWHQTSPPECGGQGAARQTVAGANILIVATNIVINGVLNVSGYPGITGMNARCNDAWWGYGGGGGSGGSGAGTITLAATNITGTTGYIYAKGGRGGDGGSQNTNDGSQCAGGSGNGPGGAGGGGGGGAGGMIYYANAQIPATINIDNSGGLGGAGGCEAYALAESGHHGTQGSPTVATTPEQYAVTQEYCNNGIDDNLNGLIDAEDPDCSDNTITSQARAGLWDTSVFNLFNNSKIVYSFYRTTANGSDGICGDDVQGVVSGAPLSCSDYAPNNDPALCTNLGCIDSSNSMVPIYRFYNPSSGDHYYSVLSTVPSSYVFEGIEFYAFNSQVSESVPVYRFWNNNIGDHYYSTVSTVPPGYISEGIEFYAFNTGSFGSSPVYRFWSAVSGDHYYSVLSTVPPGYVSEPMEFYAMLVKSNCIGTATPPEPTPPGITVLGYDYGYVDPTKQFMCYNNISKMRNPSQIPQWAWLDAKTNDKSFVVFSLNNSDSGKTFDTISNGEKWSYCNANPVTGIATDKIDELSSFKSAAGDNKVLCSQAMSMIFGVPFFDGIQDGQNCNEGGVANCCELDLGQTPSKPYVVDIAELRSCGLHCYGADKSQVSLDCDPNDEHLKYFCDINIFNPYQNTGDPFAYVDKSECAYDGAKCVDDQNYFPDSSCTVNGGAICNKQSQYCMNGQYVLTKEPGESNPSDNSCCFNSQGSSTCKNKPTSPIRTENDCVIFGGSVNTTTARCYGENITLTSGNICCFGTLVDITDYLGNLGWYKRVSPDSFLCYKEDDNSFISQCVYDDVGNNYQYNFNSVPNLDQTKKRLFGAGSSLHTILSYDEFRSGFVVDRVLKVKVQTLTGGTTAQSGALYTQNANNKYYLSKYSTLEFDILYPLNGIDMNVTLVTLISGTQTVTHELGPLSKYLTNGNEERRWHHTIIDLKKLNPIIGPEEAYYYLQFSDTPNQPAYYLLLDSITAVINTSLSTDRSVNSPNYFCTGPYGTWIPSLTPNATARASNDPKILGPYQYACEAQASFDWTGHYCCGANTRFNYGEYFNDSAKGCFAGSKILNDWTVSYVQNVKELSYGFNDYYYKDLLYFNNSYFGCQVNTIKYFDKRISFNGTYAASMPSILDNRNVVGNECKVVGSYYCSNGAWRQVVKNYPGDITQANLTIKSAPAGGELITNGGFDS